MTRRHSEASIQGVILPPSIGAPRSHPIPWAFKARTRNLIIQVFPRNGAQRRTSMPLCVSSAEEVMDSPLFVWRPVWTPQRRKIVKKNFNITKKFLKNYRKLPKYIRKSYKNNLNNLKKYKKIILKIKLTSNTW